MQHQHATAFVGLVRRIVETGQPDNRDLADLAVALDANFDNDNAVAVWLAVRAWGVAADVFAHDLHIAARLAGRFRRPGWEGTGRKAGQEGGRRAHLRVTPFGVTR